MIDHATPECTGMWDSAEGVLRCDQCAATYEATPENIGAVLAEIHAGGELRRQTAVGLAHSGNAEVTVRGVVEVEAKGRNLDDACREFHRRFGQAPDWFETNVMPDAGFPISGN